MQTTIKVGDRVTVSHPKDGVERTGEVVTISHMAERDDVWIRIDGVGTVILMVKPGTKARRPA